MTQPSEEPLAAARQFISEALTLRGAAVESVLRHNLSEHLSRMFPDRPWWVRVHSTGAESNLTFVDEDSQDRRAFTDVLVGRTTIEYESNLRSEAKFNEGLRQVKDHCAGLLNEGHPAEQILGVLSDTVEWRIYDVEVTDPALGPGEFGRDNVVLVERTSEALTLTAADETNARRLLDFLPRYLGREESRPLNASTIAHDLGFDSLFAVHHVQAVRTLVESALADNPGYADLIRKLWVEFVDYLGAPDGEQTFDAEVYVAELYLVTLAKLICADVIERRALISDDAELAAILDGEGGWFRERGLANLVEYDYFGWLNTPPEVEKLLPVARAIQDDLRAYDFRSPVGEDLFGQMMAQLARRSQRLLLGQESTPSWLATQLAEEIYQRALERDPDLPPSALDMCCGSGALVVQMVLCALRHGSDLGLSGQDLIDFLVNAATGFDIDPLAVLLAKVNWVVAARDVLDGRYTVNVPVYHADSLFNANPLNQGGSTDSGDHVLTFPGAEATDVASTVELPQFLITPAFHRFFDRLTQAVYRMAMTAAEKESEGGITPDDCASAIDAACQETATDLTDEQRDQLITFADELTSTLEALQRSGRNGIWAFVLRNAYRPALIAGQFGALITNPPWLALSKIANNPYRDRLRKLSGDFGIQPPGPSHLHIELSTIFLLHATDRYLSENAVVGCILPDTILNGYHHTPFRRGDFRQADRSVRLAIEEVWKVQSGTFKNESVVLLGRKTVSADRELDGGVVTPNGITETGFSQVERGQMLAWVAGEDASEYDAWFDNKGLRQGADVMPRTLVFHCLEPAGRDAWVVSPIDRGQGDLRYLVAQPKEHPDFAIEHGRISGDYVFDVLLSSHLDPFYLHDPAPGLLPFVRTDDGFFRAASDAELAGKTGSQDVFERILSTFGGNQKALLDHVESDRGKLGVQAELAKAYKRDPESILFVTAAGGTYPCAAYRKLDELRPGRLIIDQTLYWAVLTGESAEDEALYLTGIINSPALGATIKAFQPKGALGERHVHTLAAKATPPFDPQDDAHASVVKATRRLIDELETAVAGDDKARDVNYSMPHRRRKIRLMMDELDGYQNYIHACAIVLAVDYGDSDSREVAGD